MLIGCGRDLVCLAARDSSRNNTYILRGYVPMIGEIIITYAYT